MVVEDKRYLKGATVIICANERWSAFLPMMKAKTYRDRGDREGVDTWLFYNATDEALVERSPVETLEGTIERRHDDGTFLYESLAYNYFGMIEKNMFLGERLVPTSAY